MGRFKELSPEEQQRLDEEKKQKEEAEKMKAESMKIGDRYKHISLQLSLWSFFNCSSWWYKQYIL